MDSRPVLSVRNLKMHFPIERGLFRRTVGFVRAVDGVSFDIRRGETLGLVGESGCGKTTIARCILRVYDMTAGGILFSPATGEPVDIAGAGSAELRRIRRQIRLIFQDPYSSLNPRLPVGEIVAEPLRVNTDLSVREVSRRVEELLDLVGLSGDAVTRYPHAFSGGQRQRIGIARALAVDPTVLLCDEPVSALDVSVRSQILNLLSDLQHDLGLTYLFVSHDLSVVEHLSDRVAVMYVGRLVEHAPTDVLFRQPLHPYTEALLSAVPKPDPRLRSRQDRIRLSGEVADPSDPPPGCPFHPRCRYTTDVCRVEVPPLMEARTGRAVACHHAETLQLSGINRGEYADS